MVIEPEKRTCRLLSRINNTIVDVLWSLRLNNRASLQEVLGLFMVELYWSFIFNPVYGWLLLVFDKDAAKYKNQCFSYADKSGKLLLCRRSTRGLRDTSISTDRYKTTKRFWVQRIGWHLRTMFQEEITSNYWTISVYKIVTIESCMWFDVLVVLLRRGVE